MAISGVRMVHVVSENLEDTRAFYRDLLGMSEHQPIAGECSFGEKDQAQIWPLSFMPDDSGMGPKVGDVLMVLGSDDVRGDYERMTGKGVTFTIPPSNPYGPWEAHLRDPNGVWITLIETPAG